MKPTQMVPLIALRSFFWGYARLKEGLPVALLTMNSPDDNCPLASAFLKYRRSDMMKGGFTGTAVAQTRPLRSAMKIFEYWAFNARISFRTGCTRAVLCFLTSGSWARA